MPQDGRPAIPATPALTVAVSADGVRRYEFEHLLVEAGALVPSHDPFTFQVNPAFAQKLQPRMRDRAAAELQVLRIASTLSPDALLTDFHTLDRGAPIVGPDMLVESGNGRVMGIIRAVQDYPDNYTLYRGELEKRAGAVGVDASKAHGMKAPVLVRVRKTTLSDQERVAFVQEANVPSGISRSAIEQARTDSEKITLAMLESLEVAEGESIFDALRAQRNVPFLRAFLEGLPENERAGALDAQGRINQDGLRRASQAIFVSAFGAGEPGLRLGEMAFESADQDVRTVFNGISRALGPLAKAESLVRNKARPIELSIGDDLAQTVRIYAKIKNDPSLTVAKYLDQSQMFERELTPFQEVMLRTLDEHRRSAKRMGAIFSAYAGLVDALPPPEQGGLFGPSEPPTKELVWDQALRRAERPEQPKEREAMLVQTSILHETGVPGKGRIRLIKRGAVFVVERDFGKGWIDFDVMGRIRLENAWARYKRTLQVVIDRRMPGAPEFLRALANSAGADLPVFVGQEGTPWPTEVKGQYAARIRWCNTPKEAMDRILNWRPLRNLLYQGIAYQVAVEVCEAGFGGDQYQVSIGYRAEGAWRKGYLTDGQVKALRQTASPMGPALFKEVLTRDPGVLIFQVTLPGQEPADLVLKPPFPEEKPKDERVDPRLQPALFQGVADAAMGSTWPDPTYDPLEEDAEEEDTERDGPTIRHKVKPGPRKSGGGAMPQDKRPPKVWWESCIGGVQGDDKAAVCGRIWTRIRPSVKARIRREGEVFQAAQVPGPEMSNAFLSMVLGGAAQAVGAAIGFSIGNTLAGAVKTKPPEPTFQVVRCREDETWDESAKLCKPKPPSKPVAAVASVVNPGYVEGDQAQVDIGNLLEELDVILKNPQTMGEVDANTLRVVRG